MSLLFNNSYLCLSPTRKQVSLISGLQPSEMTKGSVTTSTFSDFCWRQRNAMIFSFKECWFTSRLSLSVLPSEKGNVTLLCCLENPWRRKLRNLRHVSVHCCALGGGRRPFNRSCLQIQVGERRLLLWSRSWETAAAAHTLVSRRMVQVLEWLFWHRCCPEWSCWDASR